MNVPAFSPYLSRCRTLIERFFGKIKHLGAVATRYEKLATNSPPIAELAATRIRSHSHKSVIYRERATF